MQNLNFAFVLAQKISDACKALYGQNSQQIGE
jgi:hypothetical protein